MKRKEYITDVEQEKCKKVVAVFSILEEEDIVLINIGRYGFAVLFYYTPPHGFEVVKTFTDSQEIFDYLWEEWLDSQLIRLAESMNMGDIDYDKIIEKLPKHKQTELLSQRETFLKKADFKDV